VVECDLAKVEVASSNLVSRSNISSGKMKGERRKINFHLSPFALHLLSRRRSQVVRQRSAKPLFIGSIPIAAFFRINMLRAAYRLPFLVWSANGLPNSVIAYSTYGQNS
jgi:hypothetical protein